MARRDRRDSRQDSEIDLTPMLDIVFILLIFFIVTAVFIREPGVEVDRPDAETDIRQKNIAILIAVTADNEIWIDKQVIDERAVRTVVEQLRAENPKGPVVIQADGEADTGVVMAVQEQAGLAGAPEISVATLND